VGKSVLKRKMIKPKLERQNTAHGDKTLNNKFCRGHPVVFFNLKTSL
jgi:hypothetical protein